MAAKIIFMGTPDYAVPTLQQLAQAYEVVLVVTQPDRPSGRGRKVIPSPVKEVALAANLPLIQPKTLRDAAVVEHLQLLEPDLIVVAAFGQILRANVLEMPPFGCINLHASLLPRWRGAAPVAAAIKAGDTETGVTLMQMDEGLDTGPIIAKRAIPINETHTRETLTQVLAELGADLLIETLPAWLNREIIPQPQDDSLITLAPRIKKAEGQINWGQSAAEIRRHVQAFYPWPGTFTYWDDLQIKVHEVALVAEDASGIAKNMGPGQVFQLEQEVAVTTGQGALILQKIQPAGKRAMAAQDFVRGRPDFIGAQLQSP